MTFSGFIENNEAEEMRLLLLLAVATIPNSTNCEMQCRHRLALGILVQVGIAEQVRLSVN